MTLKKEKLEWIGKPALLPLGDITVRVKVLDYKSAYGHDRWLVEPYDGTGKVWVQRIESVL